MVMKNLVMKAMTAAMLCGMAAPAAAQERIEATVQADVVSRYIWRGQDLGDVSLQPTLGLAYKGLSLTAWGNVGLSDPSDTEEFDLTLAYSIGGFNIGVTDYWFNKPNDRYFSYAAHETSHVFEANIGYDFGPVAVQWYTNFAGNDGVNKSGKRAYKGVGFYSVILLPIFYAKMRGTYMYVNQINLHPPLPTSISIARARNARRIEPATPRPPGRKFRIRQMESPFQKVPPQPQIPPALPGVRGMPPRSKNRATYPSTPLRRE